MVKKESEITLQIRRSFAAPREKIFKAWTQPEHLKRWFAPSDEFQTPTVEVDLRVGGKYRVSMIAPNGASHTVYGTYREVTPPSKLVYTWTWEEKPDMGNTVVTIEFMERGQETELVLTHELFPDEDLRDDHNKGWTGCLERLGKYTQQSAV